MCVHTAYDKANKQLLLMLLTMMQLPVTTGGSYPQFSQSRGVLYIEADPLPNKGELAPRPLRLARSQGLGSASA